ncbi:MAG: hypothetical protein ACJAVK_001920 [Akkermansiaceae bacterium]
MALFPRPTLSAQFLLSSCLRKPLSPLCDLSNDVLKGFTPKKFPYYSMRIVFATFLWVQSFVSAATPVDLSGLNHQEMEGLLRDLKVTRYQSKTVVDHATGTFKGNCSGLIGYVLRRRFPEAYLSVRGMWAPWRARPLAVTYYETFVSVGKEGHSKPAWKRVRKMVEVKPGDIIAWRKLSITQGLNTGHICMIAGKPVVEKDGRVRVRVIDSTSGRHFNDTRKPGTNGVGAGEMWFSINAAGEPDGYWMHEKSKRSKTHKIAIGRIVPVFFSAALQPQPKKDGQVVTGAFDADYLGQTEAGAAEIAMKRKVKFRVIERDGVSLPVTHEITEKRVNFVIKRGKILRTLRG